MDSPITNLMTKEQALAAGVPEDIFDPQIHLYSETMIITPPRTNTVSPEVGAE